MLQRFPIAFAKVQASNTCENVPTKIQQVMCSLYRPKEITEKVRNN